MIHPRVTYPFSEAFHYSSSSCDFHTSGTSSRMEPAYTDQLLFCYLLVSLTHSLSLISFVFRPSLVADLDFSLTLLYNT